jgi:hypothetical protein
LGGSCDANIVIAGADGKYIFVYPRHDDRPRCFIYRGFSMSAVMIIVPLMILYFFMNVALMSPDIRMLWVKNHRDPMEKQDFLALRSHHFHRHIIQFHRYRHETDSL